MVQARLNEKNNEESLDTAELLESELNKVKKEKRDSEKFFTRLTHSLEKEVESARMGGELKSSSEVSHD